MTLLDGGIRSMFATVLSGLYRDGTLHHATLTDDGKGGWSAQSFADVPIKCQRDRATEEMTRFNLATGPGAVEAGHTSILAKIIVLQEGVPYRITTADQLTTYGARWAILDAQEDPASSHWVVAAVQLRDAPPVDSGGSI